MSTTELAVRSNGSAPALLPAAGDWQTMLAMSDVLFKSGMLPQHIKSVPAAVAIIQKGSELGVPPMYALSNIVCIQGKPTAGAELMAALVYRDHGDEALIYEETTSERCTVTYKRRAWKERKTFSFTIEDAKKAGLLSNATWQKYPSAMLRARAVSAVARLAFPDSIGGLYTPEELGASVNVDSEGVVIVQDVTPRHDYGTPRRECWSCHGMTDDRIDRCTECGAPRYQPQELEPREEPRQTWTPAQAEDVIDAEVIEDEPQDAAPAGDTLFLACAECGQEMSKGQVTMSVRKYGKPLCLTHQKNAQTA